MLYLLKVIGYLVLSVTIFVSCGQAAQTSKILPKVDSAAPAGRDSSKLTPSEIDHYSNIVSGFFDPMMAGRFNGSVLVAKNGVILYERYKGFKHPERRKDSLDLHTSFHLASVSKTFTAMSTLKLWQEGKLDIHDSVSKYLAGFPMVGITVEMLLNHRSGLHNYVQLAFLPKL